LIEQKEREREEELNAFCSGIEAKSRAAGKMVEEEKEKAVK